MSDLPIPSEPTLKDLNEKPYTEIVIIFSGSFGDEPALYSLYDYCRKQCPLYHEHQEKKR